MARPNKQGLDYFPLDVDFFNDEKIEAISGERRNHNNKTAMCDIPKWIFHCVVGFAENETS